MCLAHAASSMSGLGQEQEVDHGRYVAQDLDALLHGRGDLLEHVVVEVAGLPRRVGEERAGGGHEVRGDSSRM